MTVRNNQINLPVGSVLKIESISISNPLKLVTHQTSDQLSGAITSVFQHRPNDKVDIGHIVSINLFQFRQQMLQQMNIRSVLNGVCKVETHWVNSSGKGPELIGQLFE